MNPQQKRISPLAESENDSFVECCLQQLLLGTNAAEPQSLETRLELALIVLERGDFQARWEVAKIMPQLGTTAIEPLLDILQDETLVLDQRWFAARILAGFDRVDALLGLAELLETTEDSELAEMAASALTDCGSSAVAVLIPLLASPTLKSAAARALAKIRCPETIAPLLTVANDSDATVRLAAIEALSSFRDSRVIPALIAALKDAAAAVRKEAASSLGFRADVAAEYDLLTHLQPLLYDFNLEVCQQAAFALGKLASTEAEHCLFEVLQSPATPLPLQLTLLQTLIWRETPSSLSDLQQVLPDLPEPGLLALIRLLGRIHTAKLKGQAAGILVDFYQSHHPLLTQTPIRQALAHSLGQLQGERARGILAVLAEDAENSVKLHAIAALKNSRKLPPAEALQG